MKIPKTLLLSLLLFTTLFFGQENKKSEAGGPPERSEILGFWKMVSFPKLEKMNKENPWPQPYQWFAFYENGKVLSMMTDKDANYSKAELQQVFDVFQDKDKPTFKYNGKFMIIENPEIANYKEIWGMNLFAKDIGSYVKKGDLMMSLDDGSGKGNSSITYYRLLRKIE